MQKIQILFPDPQMTRLRQAAREEDRPISDIIRRATESWLESRPSLFRQKAQKDVPVFHGGPVRVQPDRLREAAWSDRDLHKTTP